MSRVERFGKVIKGIGIIVAAVGFCYLLHVEGTVDYKHCPEEYSSLGWFFKNLLRSLLILVVGVGIAKASELLINLSHKRFRKVWVKNLKNNKVKTKLVEEGSTVVLSSNEVLYKVGKTIYRFR